MKKFLFVAAFMLLAWPCFAQNTNIPNTVYILFPGVPSGSCTGLMIAQNQSNADFYDCLTGTWNKVSGGGGGSGTVSGQASGVIPLGTSATVIGNQSHVDDGVTTSGVITSSEPVNAQNLPSNSPWINLANYTKHDGKLVSCSVTSGSFTITCSAASFVGGDVGKLGILYGSSANGTGATATTSLSGGAITAPSVTGAGSGYLTVPLATISGLTCTASPELKVVLSGSNYITGNTVSSITRVYNGSGCTGTPTIVITAPGNLDLPMSIATVSSGTSVILTNPSGVMPSVTNSTLNFFYGTNDTTALNNAIQTFVANTDENLNPTGIWCDRTFITSGPINLINREFHWLSPGSGSPSTTNASALLGCGIILVNTTYNSPVDAVYVKGSQNSEFQHTRIQSTNGNPQNSGIDSIQTGSGSHNNTEFNVYSDNIIGGPYLADDPSPTGGYFQGYVTPQFNYGILMNLPGDVNDQMTFRNNMIVNNNINFYQLSQESTELTLAQMHMIGGGVGVKMNSQILCQTCNFTNLVDADFVIGDSAQSQGESMVLTLDDYTSVGTHQFIRSENNGQSNAAQLFFHGPIILDSTASVIHSGTQIDLSNGLAFTPIVADLWIQGGSNAVAAPENFILSATGSATGASLNILLPGASVPASSFTNMVPNSTGPGLFKRSWSISATAAFGGQQCFSNEPLFGGINTPECNNTTVPGKLQMYGEIIGTALGQPNRAASKLSGTGSTTYYYQISALAGGVEGLPSTEVSVASQNATLSASAVNQVCASPTPGAQQFRIYESTTSGMEKLLATVAADQMVTASNGNPCYNDSAGGASGAIPPVVDSTGGAQFAGPVSAGIGSVLSTPASVTLTNATGLPTGGLVNNAVNSAKMAVVNTRRICDISVGDASGSAVTNAQLGPQKRLCYIPAASTISEMDVDADAGTPNVIVAVNHAGSDSNIVSGALATAASGGIACTNTGGTTGINGATTCTNTLQNTSIAAGDYLELVSGTAGGTAKLMNVHVIYVVN